MILTSADKISSYTSRGWWGEHTLDDVFQAACDTAADRTALVDAPNRTSFSDGSPLRLTYQELAVRVDHMAARFIQDGLQQDDIICTQLPNIVEGVIVILAAARLGLIISPIPVQYREHEISHILTHTRAKAIVTVTRFKDHAPAQMIQALSPDLPGLEIIYSFGDTCPKGCHPLVLEPARDTDRQILKRYRDSHVLTANDILTICWTSGTEANPKGVPRSHNHWFATGTVCSEAGALDIGDVLLNPFPMVNMAAIGSMLFPWLMCQGTLVQHHPFDLPTFLQQVPEEKVNYTIAAPAILNLLLKNEDLLAKSDFSSLKCLGSGSAPLSPWMVAGWQEKYNLGVMNFFGSNEGASLFSSPQDIPDPEQRVQYFPRFGVDGFHWTAKSAGWMKSRLVDLDTEEEITEPGRSGELRLTGATIFDGYFRSDIDNADIFDDQGYYKTGDTFQIAGDGKLARFYKYVGRSKELIIRGGMNISPGELDGLIDSHPHVKEAAVVGYPDEGFGERVCAMVVLHPDTSLTLTELTAHLRHQKIASFKLPEKLCLIDALPRNPMGKVVRRDLVKYMT
ncbi:class I adenylate-forming enzyme family protein [Paremcibacter congregatus]|uniref:class I adenylate-forming enzyme family protein n=1 Tax=Paremcibacter congregatus TaxID=2043170 RepID=UPI003A9014FC